MSYTHSALTVQTLSGDLNDFSGQDLGRSKELHNLPYSHLVFLITVCGLLCIMLRQFLLPTSQSQ